jgi:hypothetical protein
VRKGYLDIAKNEPHRVKLIDTRDGEKKVFEKIRRIVDNLMKGKRIFPNTLMCQKREGPAKCRKELMWISLYG